MKAPWKVSHAASGLSVGQQFKTKADAMAAAEKLAPVADWHKDKEALLSGQPHPDGNDRRNCAQ